VHRAEVKGTEAKGDEAKGPISGFFSHYPGAFQATFQVGLQGGFKALDIAHHDGLLNSHMFVDRVWTESGERRSSVY